MILAAGMGSRYGGLKQVDGVGPYGEAIIEYSIYDAIRAGFGKVVFIIRKDIEAPFREKIGNKFADKIDVQYAFQEIDSPVEGIDHWPAGRTKPWGTGHAMLVARDLIQEPFAVINADDYYGPSAFDDIVGFLKNGCSPETHAMLGYVLVNTLSEQGHVNRGVCEMDDQHNLTAVNERLKVHRKGGQAFYEEAGNQHALALDALVSMNFWGFHPTIFKEIHSQFVDFVKKRGEEPKSEFFIPLFVDTLINSGQIKVKVIPCDETWYGVTYKEDKEQVEAAFSKMVEKGVYPAPLW
ncbi:MAG: nucleotidyltransferase [Saprospiraceae bacterium]|nr:MAG: nucleotidyltransferase [Saprospiraceae bacterium]